MNLRHAVIVAFAVLLIAPGAFAAREAVKLVPQPGTELEKAARALNAEDLARALQAGDAPLVLVGEVQLGGASMGPALFVQLQSERECGSAGCNTTGYIRRNSQWVVILDSIGGSIEVDQVRHGGMRDLLVDHTNRWQWNGKRYVQTIVGKKAKLRRPAASNFRCPS